MAGKPGRTSRTKYPACLKARTSAEWQRRNMRKDRRTSHLTATAATIMGSIFSRHRTTAKRGRRFEMAFRTTREQCMWCANIHATRTCCSLGQNLACGSRGIAGQTGLRLRIIFRRFRCSTLNCKRVKTIWCWPRMGARSGFSTI